MLEEFSLLPLGQQAEILDALDPQIVQMLALGYWFWTARPEQIPPEGSWDRHIYLAGRGSGKALSLITMVPTPGGWKKMGEIQPGDTVFDEKGQPCTVTATFDRFAETAYRLHFSDGTHLDACDEHQWITWEHSDRKAYLRYAGSPAHFPADWVNWKHEKRGPKVRTTQQIVDTFTLGTRQDLNHCIPVCRPLDLPEVQLPIDPYTLGLWLGDGSSASAEITIPDAEVLEYIRQAGYGVSEMSQPEGKCPRYVIGGKPSVRDPITGRMVANGSLQSTLRECGLLKNKHIPAAYLRASVDQRLALLQGLMDSDGFADANKNSVEFCSIIKELAEQVVELARSLGQKPVIKESDAKLYGRFISKKYRVTWRPTIDAFRLSRKKNRITFGGGQQLRTQHRMIKSFERIEPQSMRCITVDSPNAMFLAGEAMIPTHNTRSGAEWLVERSLTYPHDVSGFPTERLVMAYSLSEARMVCIEGPSGILRVLHRMGFKETGPHYSGPKELRFHYTRSPKPHITFLESEAKIFFVGADPDAARGFNLADVWMDEIVKYIDAHLCWREGVRPALRADIPGDKPRAFITTTPKPIPLLQDWVQEAKTGAPSISMIRGSTFDNKLNLSEDFLRDIAKMYEGTALGRQELYGEMLDGFEGALFPFSSVHNHRVTIGPAHVAHRTVGVDPGLTGSEDGDETGVIVVCRDENDHMFVVADETVKLSGRDAALHAWRVFERYGCDTLVYESNLGKAWMQQVFTDAFRELQRSGVFPVEVTNPPLVPVFSTQGKKLRAEPVAMRYNQGRVHHIGTFETLENQMFSFDPITSKTSPDRLDALVHACRHLIDGERRKTRLISPLNYKFESAFGPAF